MPRDALREAERSVGSRGGAAPSQADPSSVARRIERIVDVMQVRGAFERYAGLPTESLRTEFYPPVPNVELVGDRELYVMLEFGFAAFVDRTSEQPAAAKPKGKAAGKEPKPEMRMAVEAGFVALYQLKPGEKLSKAALDAFALRNGLLTLNPYWREYLDSSLRRAGFPPLMAPVYNFEPPHPTTGTPAKKKT